jgi:hypothetical protein
VGVSRVVSAVELTVCARLLVFGIVGDERGSTSSCLMLRFDMLNAVSGGWWRLVCLVGQL